MTKLECGLVALAILTGLVIGLIWWTNNSGGIDLSAWARWLMEPGNDIIGLIEYYAKGAW